MEIPAFRGVFMRDRLPLHPHYVETGIVNLDVSKGRGTHWVAYRKRGNTVTYFDSYGDLAPPKELHQYFRGCNIYYNSDAFQRGGYTCGHLCLKFLNKEL